MKKHFRERLMICVLAGFIFITNVGSATGQTADGSKPETRTTPSRDQRPNIPNSIMTIGDETVTVRPEANPMRNAYFGDLHVHTTYSFDAFAFGTLTTPDDAYRYAKGEAIRHPGRRYETFPLICRRASRKSVNASHGNSMTNWDSH